MYNEWFRTLQKDISFSVKFQILQPKWICISVYLFTASFVCKNTSAMYSHKHYKMTMNNILTSGGLNIMSFLTIHIFRKYVTWKVIC